MEHFRPNPPPGVFGTEILHPADARANSGIIDEAKLQQMEGLAKRGAYEIVCKEDVLYDANILGRRFVLGIKNVQTENGVCKAIYVVQGHTDTEKNLLIHESTNLKQSSIRVIVSIAAILGFWVWTKYVSQAYLQSADKLMREVYVNPSSEVRFSHNQLLHLLKPLYGLSDSGDY